LHSAHIDRLEQRRRYYRLLDELRVIRAAQRDCASDGSSDDDAAGPTCH
jgi:hypothetical protein